MYKRICSLPLLLLLALVAAGSTAQAQSGLKAAVFDPQRVSLETKEGKRLQEDLNTLRDQKQSEIQGKEADVTSLRQQLSQQALSLSVERRTGLEMEIQRKTLELQNANELASQELQLELNNAMSRFNEMLLIGVEQFGREEGFDIIFDRSLVAYAADSLDVTTAIIDRFDEMFPGTESGE